MAVYKLKTKPGSEPVTLSEIKTHLKVTGSDEDTYLTELIIVARKIVEKSLERSLITTIWELYLDEFPSNEISIQKAPVQSIGEVAYKDTDNVDKTISSDDYQTDFVNEPARLKPAYDKDWPDTYDEMNVVKITFTSGYGNAASDVPEPIKALMKLIVAHIYENRGDQGHRTLSKTVDELINLYKVYNI